MSLENITDVISSSTSAEHRERFGQTFFGTLLGQAIALLGLLIAYVAAIATLYRFFSDDLEGLRSATGDLVFAVIILAPLAFILVFSALPTALRGWRERQLRRITIISEKGVSGQVEFRLRPYGPQDQDQYFRADGADDQAVRWLEHTEHSLLYLLGPSGAGKSSLLAASVLPRLQSAGWECLTLRVDRDPAGRLRDALMAPSHLFLDVPPPDLPLRALLERAAEARVKAELSPLLLVIDQFEESLILNDSSAQKPLLDLLQTLEKEPLPGLRLLCVFRSDYRELLFKLGLPGYVPGGNAFELAPFLREEAEDFLRRGGKILSVEGYDALFEGLDRIEDARGLYRPITLNMVGLVLQRMGGRIAGDPARLIESYLRTCLVRGRSLDFSRQILGQMITRSGTKEPRCVIELVEHTGFEPWQVTSTLTDLEADGLVRTLDRDRTRWEVSHDFLARSLGVLLGRLRPPWIGRAAPVALPVAVVGWAALLFLALDYWPNLQDQQALAELRQIGFTLQVSVTGEELVATSPSSMDDIALREFPRLYQRIRDPNSSLNLSGAYRITSLEPIKGLPLTSLDLSLAYGITSLEPLKGMPLTSLNLSRAFGIRSLEPLKGLPLTSLDLSSSDRITSLEPLEGMPLTSLDLRNADGITSLEPLKGLPLTSLNLAGSRRITSLEPLKGLPLTSLDLSLAYGITSLEPLKGMPLTSLDLSHANRITSLEPLKGMPLTSLDLSHANRITSLEPLKGMPLKLLNLSGSRQIRSLEPLKGMPLTSLDLSFTNGIASFEPLMGLPLTSLDLQNADGITSLEPLKGMPLTALDLRNADGITSLEPLKGMPLTSLNLQNADGITSLEPLRGMPLTSLDLSGAVGITSLEPLKGMPLTSLYLQNADGITSLEPLKGMPLTVLNLQDADGITSLEPLRDMPLQWLDLSLAEGIMSLEPLSDMDPGIFLKASPELLATLQ